MLPQTYTVLYKKTQVHVINILEQNHRFFIWDKEKYFPWQHSVSYTVDQPFSENRVVQCTIKTRHKRNIYIFHKTKCSKETFSSWKCTAYWHSKFIVLYIVHHKPSFLKKLFKSVAQFFETTLSFSCLEWFLLHLKGRSELWQIHKAGSFHSLAKRLLKTKKQRQKYWTKTSFGKKKITREWKPWKHNTDTGTTQRQVYKIHYKI